MICSFEELRKMTHPKLVRLNYSKRRHKIALMKKSLGIWQTITWEGLYFKVKYAFLGLKRLGLQRGDKIAILATNDPEWYVAEFAAQSAGGVAVGIIADCTAAEVKYLVDFCDARFVFVNDQEQVDKMLEIKDQIPKVQKVIYWNPKGMWAYEDKWLLGFEELLTIGREYEVDHPTLFDEEIDKGMPDDMALFIYTSGTGGLPKAVQLSYSNLLSVYSNGLRQNPDNAFRDGDKVLSFFFPGISGEQGQYVCGLLVSGLIVCFPEEVTTAAMDTREVAPATALYLPRMYQAMQGTIRAKVEDSSIIKRLGYNISIAVGYKLTEFDSSYQKPSLFWRVLGFLTDYLGARQVRDKLGLLHTRTCFTGAAGIGPELFRFFRALRLNLLQGYGASETSGAGSVQRREAVDFGACGPPLLGMDLRISDEGEGLFRGPNVSVGYYKDHEATAKGMMQGWWHSGDAAHLTEDEQLVITGRISELATLRTGALYSPVYIENSLTFSPYISDAQVIGRDRDFVTAIIIIDFQNVGRWAEKRGIVYTTLADLSQKPEIYNLVQKEVNRVNRLLPTPVRIRRFVNFYKEFDPDEGELTRTRKLRRGFLEDRYGDIVEALYGTMGEFTIDSEVIYHDGRRGKIKANLHIKDVEVS
jgi:long-chain acyl-CoA synthetase